ncbi:mechanosensitive ion channel [bacterium]|nr:mechanosensitive ion channel [bacterium]
MTFAEVVSFVEKVLRFPLFPVKNTMITIASFFTLLLVMLGFIILSRILSRILLTKVLNRTKLDQGLRYAATRITQYLIIIIGSIVAFQSIGIDLSGLLVIFGFLSVGIGFGLQNITSNFISGLIILLERPIKIGDRVTVGETEGDVSEINIRSTTIRSLNNISIIVPNSEFISSTVVNWSHGDLKVRLDIDVGVSYSSDLETVLRSLNEVADESAEILKQPKPEVLFMEFGDSSWNLRLRVWIQDPKRHQQVRSDILCAIVRKFRQNDVEIPFPQRDLHIRSPLPVPYKSESVDHNGS